jgi:hypothetical protein
MKITGSIDNLTEHDIDRLRAAGPGSRFEVVLDYTDGDHHELEAHFRLVEEHPTQQAAITSADVVTSFEHGVPVYRLKDGGRQLTDAEIEDLAARERAEFPVRTIHVGGLNASGPVMEMPVVTTEYPAAELFMARASDLLAAMIGLMKISPLVLGIPSGDEPLHARIYKHLTGTYPAGDREETHMGKHGDGKPADSKPGGGKSGGAHEKGGGGKGGK